MKTFLSAFLYRYVCWWLPLSLPWCVLFFGFGSHVEAEGWFNQANLTRALRALLAALLFTWPVALFAAVTHTAAIYRQAIFSSSKKSAGCVPDAAPRLGNEAASQG